MQNPGLGARGRVLDRDKVALFGHPDLSVWLLNCVQWSGWCVRLKDATLGLICDLQCSTPRLTSVSRETDR